jgi:nitrogen fixation-related uncharacterized protein
MSTTTNVRAGWRFNWTTWILAVFILLPAAYGFGRKFYELVVLIDNEEGAFTIMPIVNYLLASLGFTMMFLWAILHGMFRDIEGPKETMLANEAKLDAEVLEERETWKGD